ncbi:MAG TPA: hypothetical protein VFS83_06055 [Ktedonobacterales bacterium]|nr:hypothetical protein [Ktedonobacterales bacterium]
MNNGPEARSIGWNLGIVSGLFAALQVLISASAARANIATIESMRWSLARLESGGGNPLPLLGLLVPVVLITYGAMIVTGAACLVLCWYAGRLTAYVNGRRGGVAGAGFRVALLSGLIWMAFSVIISLLLHADGTITGVVASTHDGSALPAQLAGLLIQQLIFGAIGLGLGAWAGAIGSNSAPLPETPAMAAPAYVLPTSYGMYPAYPPLAGYPTNGGYPVNPSPYQAPAPYAPAPSQPQPFPQPLGSAPPAYPPPPDFYRMAGADQAFTAPQEPVSSAPEDAPAPDGTANQPPAE